MPVRIASTTPPRIRSAKWPQTRMIELAPRYWAETRARLDPFELAMPLGPITVHRAPLALAKNHLLGKPNSRRYLQNFSRHAWVVAFGSDWQARIASASHVFVPRGGASLSEAFKELATTSDSISVRSLTDGTS
jgi:hypothetical protein